MFKKIFFFESFEVDDVRPRRLSIFQIRVVCLDCPGVKFSGPAPWFEDENQKKILNFLLKFKCYSRVRNVNFKGARP